MYSYINRIFFMADSILRLRVDSAEYDNKLKRATEGLTRYIDGCRKIGGTLEVVGKETLDYVRSLGQMETTSRTATGKLAEMKKTFVDLSVQYKSLTDAEKSAPFGRGIAASLDQLKPRILDAKKELDDINKSLGGGGGGLFGGDKLGGMLQVFGGNLMTKAFEMASSAALNFVSTVKDAAVQGIEMAKAGEGIRVAFDRLNRPDLLDKLREATHNTVTDLELMKQAVKFNDFRLNLDQMGILLAFAQQKAKDTGQSVDYMVDSIVTGLGRQSLMILDNLGLSASEIKERMRETGDMTTAVADIIKDQMSKAGDYVETAADRAAKADTELKNAMEELGRTLLPLEEQGESMWNSLEIGALKLLNDGVKPLVPVLLNLKDTIGDIAESVSNSSIWDGYVSALGTVADKAAQAAGPLGKVYMLMKMIAGGSGGNVGEGASVGALGLPDYTIDNIPEIVVTGNLSKKKTKGGSGKEFDISKIAFTAAAGEKFDPSQYAKESGLRPENILGPSEEWEKYKDTITGSIGSIGESFSNLTEWTPNFDPYKDSMDNMTESLKQQKMAFGLAAQAAQGFGAALSGIEDPAAKAAGTVVSAIASIALGFAMASSSASTAGTGWGWLAWLGAGMSAMATTIATIHSLTGYQNGGMVKGYAGGGIASGMGGGTITGTTYSNDQIPIMANAGEVILNKAQQSTLAQNLQGNDGGGMRVVGEIQGEKIVLVANRYFKRTGQGEIVTW